MRIEQFVIDGLGHLSTLLADDDAGVAAVIDPRRDVDVYLAAAWSATCASPTSSRRISTTTTCPAGASWRR